jgi:hypothetical protein
MGAIAQELGEAKQGKCQKYLIGYFRIRDVLLVDTSSSDHSSLSWIRIARSNEEVDPATLREIDPQIRTNAHFLRPSDQFACAVGQRRGMRDQARPSLLLPNAIPLTTRFPFDPLPFAESVYGKLKYPRGHKRIPNESRPQGLETLLRRIAVLE